MKQISMSGHFYNSDSCFTCTRCPKVNTDCRLYKQTKVGSWEIFPAKQENRSVHLECLLMNSVMCHLSSGWARCQGGEDASEHPGRSQLHSASSSVPPAAASPSSQDAFLPRPWLLLPPAAPYDASSRERQRDARWVQTLMETGL